MIQVIGTQLKLDNFAVKKRMVADVQFALVLDSLLQLYKGFFKQICRSLGGLSKDNSQGFIAVFLAS